MTSLNSSIVFWNETEIDPRSILLISSGAGGDRLLFWHPLATSHLGNSQKTGEREQTRPKAINETMGATQRSKQVPETSPASSHLQPPAHTMLHKGKFNLPTPTSEAMPFLPATSAPTSASPSGHPHSHSVVVAAITGGGGGGGGPLAHLTTSASSAVVGSPSQLAAVCSAAEGSAPDLSTSMGRGSVPVCTSTASTAEMIVEGMPVSSLLSLLHPSTQQMQHKIYVKMANKVFVGVAFSLSRTAIGLDNLDPVDGEEIPTPLSPQAANPFAATSAPFSIASSPLSIMDFLEKPEEDNPTSAYAPTHTSPGGPAGNTNTTPPTTTTAAAAANSRVSQHKIDQTLTSFAIVFAFSDVAPPCVLSHYTELARRTGVQLRRAELFWQYLSTERDRVIALLDSQAGITPSAEEVSGGGGGGGSGGGNSGIGGPGSGGNGGGTGAVGLNGSAAGGGGGGVVLCAKEEDRGAGGITATDSPPVSEAPEGEKGGGGPEALAGQAFALVAKRSPLCAQLQHIVESVTSVGRVNVAIKGRYPVFFCLPYKAYAILPVGQPHLMPNWPALRPRAVWQAMEKMRPYHTLLLTTPKEKLLSSFLPPDANRSLASFVKELSPTVGLNDLSVGMHSQGHCLRLALWLVYNGHAIVAYPVAGNNSYTLAPLSHLWLQPQLLLEFAERFPHLNLAQVLSSFADFQTLKSHLSVDTDCDQRCSPTGCCVWESIDAAESVELISWLLRRRLIIQMHTYVIPVLPAGATTTIPDAGLETATLNEQVHEEAHEAASEAASYSEEGSSEHRERSVTPVAEENQAQQQQQQYDDMPTQFLADLPPDCPESLLEAALPNLADRHAVLTHYRNSVRDPALLRLFLRILPQLPAHLEDLIFVQSVDRETLILCIENFSQFLTTIRLPDPVTACFAGIEWPT